MALDFLWGVFPMSPKKYPFSLTPRAAWVFEQLRELTDASGDSEIVRRSLQIYDAVLKGHQNRAVLFVARPGKRPFPIHLLSPAAFVQLPAEADIQRAAAGVMVVSRQVGRRLEELMKLTQCNDISTLVENALLLHYDLLQRELQGEVFLVREPETSILKEVTLFVPIEDGESDPAA